MSKRKGILALGPETPEWLRFVAGSGQPVEVVCHEFADEDAIGSACGLHSFLRQVGCQSQVLIPEPVPFGKRWIAGFPDPVPGPAEALQRAGVVVAVDSASLERLGNMRPVAAAAAGRGMLVNVDHHPSNTAYGNINQINPEAIATAQMIAGAVHRTGVAMNRTTANALYAGLYADSGGFRYPNTGAESFAMAKLLAESGAEIDAIGTQIESISEGQMQLQSLATAASNVKLSHRRQLAVVPVSAAMIRAAGVKAGDAHQLIASLQRVRTYKVVVLLIEDERSGNIRISIRSKEPYDAGKIAAALGGGGHKLAAGAQLPDSLEAATARVTSLALRHMTGIGRGLV